MSNYIPESASFPQQFVTMPDEFIIQPNYEPYTPRPNTPLALAVQSAQHAATAANDTAWERMCLDSWENDWADESMEDNEYRGPLTSESL